MLRTILARAGRVVAVATLAALAHAAHGLTTNLAASDAEDSTLPSGEVIRFLSLGHATTVADIHWLKLVQYLGTPRAEAREWPGLEPLATLVVGVDPLFGYAYEASGIVLSSVGRYESSNTILERGMSNVPYRWQLPFFAGFNYWSALGDLERGADLVLRAAQIKGSPRYLPELAARLFSSAGTLEEGIAALDLSIQSTPDSNLRGELLRRRDQMEMERALRILEDAVAHHIATKGRPPSTLADLEDPKSRIVTTSPLGKAIDLDPSTGAVSSSLLPRRLMVYRPGIVPEALATP